MATQTFAGTVAGSTNGIQLHLRVFLPREPPQVAKPTILTVHPYSVMGGSSNLMAGAGAVLCAKYGYPVVLYDQRGVGGSSGSSTWFASAEADDTCSVIRWLRSDAGRAAARLPTDEVILLGSSAGACIAGAAASEPGVVAAAFTGYTYGFWASILFGGHFAAVKRCPIPKLFIQGSADGFTSASQLQGLCDECAGEVNIPHIIDGPGHFELEGPDYDRTVSEIVGVFFDEILKARRAADGQGDDKEADALQQARGQPAAARHDTPVAAMSTAAPAAPTAAATGGGGGAALEVTAPAPASAAASSPG